MHHWKVTLSDNTGRTTEHTFSAKWDPAKTDNETIGKACAIQVGREMKREYVYVAVESID